MKPSLFVTCTVIAFGIAMPAAAQNLNFLRDSVLAELSKEDRAAAAESFRNTLDHAPDNERREWQNPKSGASGALTVTRSYHDTLVDFDCKQVVIELSANGRQSKGPYFLCKAPDGKWKFTRPPGATTK